MGGMVCLPVIAAVNRPWGSGGGTTSAASNQRAALMGNQTTNTAAITTTTLPIAVPDAELARRVLAGDKTVGFDAEDLSICGSTWPNGEFAWTKPNAGISSTGASGLAGGIPSTCSAVVELRDSTSDVLLATAYAPMGGTMDCNIDAFPTSGYLPAIEKFTFPSDREPTEDEVIDQMDQERRSNAKMKLIAGAIVGGIGANAMTASDSGKSAISFAKGDQQNAKIGNTLLGAVGGAGSMYATSQMGTVAGTATESAIINAAGGAVVGNMASGLYGNSTKPRTRMIGGEEYIEGVIVSGGEYKANVYYDGKFTYYVCQDTKNDDCERKAVTGFVSDLARATEETEDKKSGVKLGGEYMKSHKAEPTAITGKFKIEETTGTTDVLTKGVGYVDGVQKPAIAKVNPELKESVRYKANNLVSIYNMNLNGTLGDAFEGEKSSFRASSLSASEGRLIDFQNEARNKATLVGAGAGAGIGAFAGIQQANDEVSQRYVASVQQYKDSLRKFYCQSGTRFLGYYNELLIFPKPGSKN